MAEKKAAPTKVAKKTRAKTSGSKGVTAHKKVEKIDPQIKSLLRKAPAKEAESEKVPVVGIGASAGGLEAFEQFFTNMPADTGIAFVLIQHLDPKHKSILTDLVQRYTRMKVAEVEDGMVLEPNSVYVIPPNRYMAIFDAKLHLMEPSPPAGLRTPIDFFFRSLAEDRKEEAICIVLSGTGTEGTQGLRAIKGEGGMGMVQAPESAKYDGMPKSAAATGLADYILPVERLPEQLIAYLRRTMGKEHITPTTTIANADDLMEKIFIVLRSKTGHNFSGYKPSTIIRRLERRMVINEIPDLTTYLRYLQEAPEESVTLFNELLIGVTNFFRDPESFEALKSSVISEFCKTDRGDRNVRVWVPGCSTGEEAYSIAIMFLECMEELNNHFNFQVFATDIDNKAIAFARAGLYPQGISVHVSQDILRRYFHREDASFRVKKTVRESILFAAQNVISDPPFSKVDLISCRNLLIYLSGEVQKKVLPLFHYALNQDGYLFLGSSETIGGFTDLFSVVNRKWKIYKRSESTLFRAGVKGMDMSGEARMFAGAREPDRALMSNRMSYREATERILLDNYSPAAVVINENGEILYVHGRTGKYLEIISGEFSGNIVGLAREGLKPQLVAATRKAVTGKKDVLLKGLRIKTDSGQQFINLVIKPIAEPQSMKGLFVVLFEDIEPEKDRVSSKKKSDGTPEEPRIQELENELQSTREYLQASIEELETSNEELKSLNEELQSSNEELQSSNEELETSREELQSVNEELTTVNTELEHTITELSKKSSDIANLFSSTEIGIIFLDSNLNIDRFTPAMTRFINLIPGDVGRPVSHIASNMRYENLEQDAMEVLATLNMKEVEVWTKKDQCYVMKIRPYRTIDNVIDGVVVTFMDITEHKRMDERLTHALHYSEGIVNTVREPMLALTSDFRVKTANRSFYRFFKTTKEQTEGKLIYDLGNREWDIPKLRELLEKILPESLEMEDFKVEHEFSAIGKRTMILNARRLEAGLDFGEMILLAIEDITEKQTKMTEVSYG